MKELFVSWSNGGGITRSSADKYTGPFYSQQHPGNDATRVIRMVPDTEVAAERQACADLVRQLRDSINELSLPACAMKDALDQAEAAILARGKKGAKA